MNCSLPLLLLLLTASLLGPAGTVAAQTTATAVPAADSLALPQAPANVSAQTAPRAVTLRRARQLELERRYESAWQLLSHLDSTNADPVVAMQKARLALSSYTATDRLTRFAFRDLKLTDLPPDSLRQLGQDSPRYRFAVRRVLEHLQRQHPDNYRLARALGDYFYTVQQCDCAEQGLGEDELFLRTIAEYETAHAHGQGDYLSYFALGYAYQRLGRFQQSLAPFERSLELRPNNPTVHLNLAFVLLELRDLKKARYHARSAQLLFPDAHHKDDAGFLLKEIEQRIEQLKPSAAAKPQPLASEAATAAAPEPEAASSHPEGLVTDSPEPSSIPAGEVLSASEAPPEKPTPAASKAAPQKTGQTKAETSKKTGKSRRRRSGHH